MTSMAKKGLLLGASPRLQIPDTVVGRLVFDYLRSDGYLINSIYFDDFLYSTDYWLVKVLADKGEPNLPSFEPVVASVVYKATGQGLQFLPFTLT